LHFFPLDIALPIKSGYIIDQGGSPMKRLIIGAVIAVAIINPCARIGRTQSSDSSAQPATLNSNIIPAGIAMAIQLDTPLNTFLSKKGDNVIFHTAADVIFENQILIPKQSLVYCRVKKSKGVGTMGERAEIQLSLENVKLPDGTMLPLKANIIRAGSDPVRDSKITGESGTGGGIMGNVGNGIKGVLLGFLGGGPQGAIYGATRSALSPMIGTVIKRVPELDFPANTMFEARFEKPLKIPAPSVIAQNRPAAISTAVTDAATAIMLADEPTAAAEIEPISRPSSKHPQIEQPIGLISVLPSEPDAALLPADMFMEEALMKSRLTLKHTDITPTTEIALVSKPEPSPIASPVPPRKEARSAETAGDKYHISVNVKMVQVDAVVRDCSGRIMSNLGVKDFKVYDNNVLQELAGLYQDKTPLAVAIVVDYSGSVMPYISQLRYIASRALSNLKEQDEVCLFAFNQNVQLVERLTADRQRIAFAIDRIGGGGGTNILDALYAAADYLASAAPNRRHAMILISDNQQTVRSMAGERDVITIAEEKDIVIYSLKTGVSMLPSVFPLGNRNTSVLSSVNPLQSVIPFGNPQLSTILGEPVSIVAHDSGGEVIEVTNIESLDCALNMVISRLRTSYSLGYYPSDSRSGMFHAITVRLADKFGKSGSDYSIQAKKGYYPVQSPTNSDRLISPTDRSHNSVF
jgi:VWFA-related protein